MVEQEGKVFDVCLIGDVVIIIESLTGLVPHSLGIHLTYKKLQKIHLLQNLWKYCDTSPLTASQAITLTHHRRHS